MGLWDACNREDPSTAAYLTAQRPQASHLNGTTRSSLRGALPRRLPAPRTAQPRNTVVWSRQGIPFVSLLSDSGVSIEQIADLCGHSGTTVTESVYRHQLRLVLLSGAIAMDRIFDPEALSLN